MMLLAAEPHPKRPRLNSLPRSVEEHDASSDFAFVPVYIAGSLYRTRETASVGNEGIVSA